MYSNKDFFEALEIASSGRGDISKEQRVAAETYLQSLQSSSEGLNLTLYLLSNDQSLQNSSSCFFWATNTILVHLNESSNLLDEKGEAIYRHLLDYLKRYIISLGQTSHSSSSYTSDFILNKHAQVMVASLQFFFNCNCWKGFLVDLVEMHRQSVGQCYENFVTMYVLRVLENIDERVVSVRDRVERARSQREVDMQIKDAMRESVIPYFVDMWFNILSQSRSSPVPEMITLSLDLVKSYTEWIDIDLLLDEKWILLLYYYLNLPVYRVSACECLLSLINKKQECGLKRETLAKLRIMEEIPNMIRILWSLWSASDNSTDETNADGGAEDLVAFTDAVATLCTAVGSQLLRLVDACNTAMGATLSSVPSDGSSSHDSLVTESSSSSTLLSYAESLLNALHTVVSYLAEIIAARHFDIPMATVISFVQTYVKSSFFTLSEAEAMLDPLFKRTIIDRTCHSSSSSPDGAWDEGIIEDRKLIFLVISLIHRRFPDYVYAHVQHIVWCATLRAERPQPPLLDGRIFKNTKTLGIIPFYSLLHVRANREAGEKNERIDSEPSESSLMYYFYASSPFLEASLRYVYEIASSIKLETLRDTQAPITQVIERLLRFGALCFFTPLLEMENTSCASTHSAPQSSCNFAPSLSISDLSLFTFLYGQEKYSAGCSAVHLSFFETLYRYHLFVVYHPEYLQTLLEMLLFNPYGVCHPQEKARMRICSLLRQIVFALLNSYASSPLLPYAIDMVEALDSVISAGSATRKSSSSVVGSLFPFSVALLNDTDKRELYEAMGMLLSVAAVATPKCNNTFPRTSKIISETGEFSVDYFQERLDRCHKHLQRIAHGLLEQLGATSIDAVNQFPFGREQEGVPQCSKIGSSASHISATSRISSPLGHSSPISHFGDVVAECESYCSSWAKGLRLGYANACTATSEASVVAAQQFYASAVSLDSNFSPEDADAGIPSDRFSLRTVWQLCVSNTLFSMLETIGPVWRSFQMSSVVREKTGFFFSQLINVMPAYNSLLESSLVDYLCSSLQSWNENERKDYFNVTTESISHVNSPTFLNSVHNSFDTADVIDEKRRIEVPPVDLNRILRLLHQLVGTAGKRAANTLLIVTPLLWKSIKSSVGSLRMLSLSGNESSGNVDQKKFFQMSGFESMQRKSAEEFLASSFAVKSEKFRESVEVYKNYFLLLVNAATFNCSTIFLSLSEKTFEETFEQLTNALLFPAELDLPKSSLQFISRILTDPPNPPNKTAANFVPQSSEGQSRLLELYQQLREPILSVFFPTCISVFTSVSFDWKDAKNALLCSDFLSCAQSAVKRYGEEALQLFFSLFEPFLGRENAQGLCIQLRDEIKVTPALRNHLRNAFQVVQHSSSNFA